jgi:hypothetical protein
MEELVFNGIAVWGMFGKEPVIPWKENHKNGKNQAK